MARYTFLIAPGYDGVIRSGVVRRDRLAQTSSRQRTDPKPKPSPSPQENHQ